MIRLRDRFFDKNRFVAATIFQYYYQSSKEASTAALFSSMIAHDCLKYFGIGGVTVFTSLDDETVSRAAASIRKAALQYLLPIMRTVKTIEDGRRFLSDTRITKIQEGLIKAVDYAFLSDAPHLNQMVLDAMRLYSPADGGDLDGMTSPDFYLWRSLGLLSPQSVCGVEVTLSLQAKIYELAASKSDLSVSTNEEIWPSLSSLFGNEFNKN